MKKITKYLFLFAVIVGFTACQEDLEIGDAGAKTLSGDWVVSEYSLDSEFLYGPYTLQLYNTSFDPDSIWIDNIYDSGHKIKCGKLTDTTFAVTGSTNVAGTRKMDIVEGKVINGDSIVFRVVLYDMAGEVLDDYLEAGHRYTGWPEDQH